MAGELILIVDDEPIIRFVLANFIRQLGHEPVCAGSGAEAAPLIDEARFAVAILDLVLPDTSGLKLLGRIKQVSADTEVLIMTGSTSMELAVEAIRQGAYDYICKPFQLGDVQATLQRALQKRGRICG